MIVNEQSMGNEMILSTTNESDFKVDDKNFIELLIKDNSEIKNIVLDIVKSNTELLIKENTEFKNIILDMVKSNTELQKQMMADKAISLIETTRALQSIVVLLLLILIILMILTRKKKN